MGKRGRRIRHAFVVLLGLVVAAGVTIIVSGRPARRIPPAVRKTPLVYKPHAPMDSSGGGLVRQSLTPWGPDASLETVRQAFEGAVGRRIRAIDRLVADPRLLEEGKIPLYLFRSIYQNSEGEAGLAYRDLADARILVERNDRIAPTALYSLIFYQGETALRRGENENCILCRGESSCILPISAAAVHAKPSGSRLAIKHFSEYLERFPDDLEARWLLNIAHMTLGEHPRGVDPRFLISLDRFQKSEFDVGRFRDVGDLVGVNRLNQSGGAIMEDFDGDGRLDLVVTSWDPTESMAFYRNRGDGSFEDRSAAAGLSGQFGGLVCYQTDYNNDGLMDVHIPRGAWYDMPIRPSLLRNNGNGTFTDVTKEAGLLDPVNSNSASWADYDNDGFLDVFVACEKQANRLYHNRRDGTFEEVAAAAGVAEDGRLFSKGSAWIDYDNDDYPDLFVNHLAGFAALYHNNRDGSFVDVTETMDVSNPAHGFSCWAWDYDNDGWLDLYATCYDRTLKDVVKGLLGEPSALPPSRLYRNVKGERFDDKTDEAGLDLVTATMGSNFADFDNDGFLDFYLGTGEPNLSTLVPNRMFKNVDGKRFAEITASSGTGHLQKGHAVACGDWDRDGDVDVFIEMGGAVKGDMSHNILFQNPGQGNHWLTVKLVGKQSNRPAIGARIKVVVDGPSPMTIHRHVSSGSSFGANPLQQTIGLGKSRMVSTLEIHWPTSGTTQILHDVAANQSIEVTEFQQSYRKLDSTPITIPERKMAKAESR